MKTYLPLFFLFITITLFGQNYRYFPEQTAVWSESHSYIPDCGRAICTKAQLIQSGDTIINNFYYNKIFESGQRIVGWDDWPPTDFPLPIYGYYLGGYLGAIRQDSVNKKVYFLPKEEQEDTLIYDFNMSVGDRLPMTYLNNLIDTIIEIDSIMLGDNTYVKRYHPAKLGYGHMHIIEGIGSTLGLLTKFYFGFEQGDELNCFMENNNGIYPTNSACEIYTGVNKIQKSPNYSFYYDVDHKMVSYTSLDRRITGIRIYNINGITVLQHNPESNESDIIFNYPVGIYFSRIMFEDGEIAVGRFINN